MVRKLVEWALNSPLIVVLLAVVLAGVGYYSFVHINVEAYPDPAPAVIEVIAQWPGASAEEMERLVTTPLEITLAGMPGLKATHSKSLFGLTHLRNVYQYGVPYEQARQEVINRLAMITQPLPSGVTPQISPASPIGEIFRYTLKTPKDSLGNDIYTLNDLKAMQDWLVEREFRRVPRIIDVTSFGGTVKRYEIQPDPDRMKRFGITLNQLSTALANSNANVGGDYLIQGRTVKVVRCLGVIGGGKDPMEAVFAMKSAQEAAAYLRQQERMRCNQIRDIVIISNNYGAIRVDDIVDGGPLPYRDAPSTQGVVVRGEEEAEPSAP
jgi:heavy metal efflux system protein